MNWSAAAATEANIWASVAHGNGVWVAVSSNGASQVMRSVATATASASASGDPGVPGIFLTEKVCVGVSCHRGSGPTFAEAP